MNKIKLVDLYFNKKLSMAEIATKLKTSVHKISYWMDKYKLKRRSISEAIYVKYNPRGDPFKTKNINCLNQAFLNGLGLGLYWGEGTKTSKHAVRISNSEPEFIKIFISFLTKIYQIETSKLRFALHIFNDIDLNTALNYWSKKLNIPKKYFYKTQVIKLNKKGTYNKKSKFGVCTLIFGNYKLKNKLMKDIDSIKSSCS